jgi:coenzyme F420 hydrogenase subunit beta
VDRQLGPARDFLMGEARDADLRERAASGGVATALLLHCLEQGQVDEVAVVQLRDNRPVVLLTADPAEVHAAAQSKYGPVPVMQIIAELCRRPRRIAITCTPCQLGGWMRATERLPALRECLQLSVGLFCGYVQSYDALPAIAATAGVPDFTGVEFEGWRCGPFPGSARFKLPDGRRVDKKVYAAYDVAIPHFSLQRCFLCPDGGNWLADVTLGDYHAGGLSQTVIVCRTARGAGALQSAQQAGWIELRPMTDAEVRTCSISRMATAKLLPALHCIAWRRAKGLAVPEFDYPPVQRSRLGWLAVWRYRMILWARCGWRRRFLLSHPRVLEKTGHFLYCFPRAIPGFNLAVRLAKWVLWPVRRKVQSGQRPKDK